MKEIEVRVEPNSASLNYYKILWREKRRFNLFNTWKTMYKVWDGAYLSYDQPVLFESFEWAVDYAKQLKENPKLIQEHYLKEDKIYEEAKIRRKKEYDSRNKSINI